MTENERQAVKVLVVDDENIVVSLVRDALEDEGYDIVTADSGEQAVQVLREQPVDLLITDIRMPHMDGTELVQRARQINPMVGVIYMTGYANLNSAKDAIKQGAFDYILKPFELTEIRQAVAKAVERIHELSAGKDSGEQLDRLSDLNQMLVTVGDRKSLCTVSLRFAMMHFEADHGALLHWDRARTNFELITIAGSETEDRTLTMEALTGILASAEIGAFREPVIASSIYEHPLCKLNPQPETVRDLLPNWFDDNASMVVVPVWRADALYGAIMIKCPNETTSISNDFKMLNIAAGQLAVSLENLFLLEETQTAYATLKELQDETIQLEKMATRGEMSAEIGHELNNFLGVVAGNLSLLDHHVRKVAPEAVDKYLTAIQTNVEKMTKFTAGLMELTPIASKKEILCFDQLITEVIDYLKPQKRFRGVTIKLDPIPSQLPFEADNVHIQQLLYNLFNNAADATMDRDKRTINVTVTHLAQDKRFRFVIRDTGVGIEPENLEKAFSQKFTTKKNGHGFGLLVCKRIVESHEGVLTVDSTPGVGTSIQIDFPIAQVESAEPVPV